MCDLVHEEFGLDVKFYMQHAMASAKLQAAPVTHAKHSAIQVGDGGALRLHVRCAEDLLFRLEKAPDGCLMIPELDDFEVVNRTHRTETGSIAWFLDRAVRNLESARQSRGFDLSGLDSDGLRNREEGIRGQIRALSQLRRLERDFELVLEDPSGLSTLTPASEAVLKAQIKAQTREFPEVAQVPKATLSTLDASGIAAFVLDRHPQTVVMLGAGASTSAGIPDFRSPGTGLYDNLQAYNLPRPTAVFELDYFRQRPEPFFRLCRELWPGTREPTAVHRFVRSLHENGLLLRCYTQNIDGLEHQAGIPAEKLVEAHGHFRSAHGVETGKGVPIEVLRDAVDGGGGSEEVRARCGELAKPDIVFFGEPLPQRFDDLFLDDLRACELLIIVGTSLQVAPFNQLVSLVPESCPRVLVNREPAGLEAKNESEVRKGRLRGGLRIEAEPAHRNTRDVFLKGTCDDGVSTVAEALGWPDNF